jgi:hypothetical protein
MKVLESLRVLFDSAVSRPGFKTPEPFRRRLLIGVGVLASILVATMAYKLGRWSALDVTAESRHWENALQARLIAFRLKVALGLMAGTLGLSYGVYQLLDRSRLGARLLHWDESHDTEYSAAAKTLTAGLVFSALTLGLLSLASQVLR